MHSFTRILFPIIFVLLGNLSAQKAPEEIPEGVTIQHDLDFLEPGREEKLDLYLPQPRQDDQPSPAIVIIHGGGWVKGDKNREREFVTGTTLAQAGYVCISINYETRKGHRWPNNLYDCKNAVRWLRVNSEELQVDPDRIGVIGGSAGGHLAMMVAYTGDNPRLSPPQPYPSVSDKVSACVNMYGISNLLTRKVTTEDGTPTEELKEHRLFSKSREEGPAMWRNASPVNYINKESPPTLSLHGTADNTVDRDQSKELDQTLKEAGVESTLILVDGANHAWPLRTKKFDYTDEVTAFFDKHLKKEALKKTSAVLSNAPNVLFIAVDDLNDWEGALGHPEAKTPNMDRLFKQGVLFTNAHCSQAVCNASRNSLLSGLHPTSSGWYGSTKIMQDSYQEVMGDHVMLPQYFKDHGYHTLAVGKVFHSGVSDYEDRSDDFWNETGPRYSVRGALRKRGDGYKGTKFYPFPKEGSQMVQHYGEDYADGNSLCYGPLDREDMPDGKMYDEIIADWTIDKLDEDYEQPFFMAVGFVRPHAPFTAPREFYDLYNLEDIQIPDVPDDEMADVPLMGKAIAYGRLKGGDHHAVVNLRPTFWQEMVYGYLACVSFVDAQIGKVVTALEESGHADNTIIVLWSDHGQHLGEKKKWRKQSLWEEATRVPLFFKTPAMETAGQTCHEAVGLLDLYPTLLDLCKLPAAPKAEGLSLVPLLEDPNANREEPVLMSWYYGNHAIRSKEWRYIQYRDGTQELYRHPTDAAEHRNLADDPKSATVISELKKSIPTAPALPAGDTEWEGDKLDRLAEDWKANGIPEWLK